jgi:glutathione S-transferase
MPTLYASPISTCSRKIICLLHEKQVDYNFRHIDLTKGEQKSPEYLRIQPFGKVPAWTDDDGFQVIESRAILKYLDAKYDGVKLVPSDLRQFASMEQWISVEYSYFTPAAMTIIYQRIFLPMRGIPCDEAKVEEGRVTLGPILDTLAAAVSNSEYLTGSSFTLADIVYLPYLEYLKAAGSFDLVEARPALFAWWERCSSRPSWQYAISGAVLERQVPTA